MHRQFPGLDCKGISIDSRQGLGSKAQAALVANFRNEWSDLRANVSFEEPTCSRKRMKQNTEWTPMSPVMSALFQTTLVANDHIEVFFYPGVASHTNLLTK